MKLQISLSATPILYHITRTQYAASIARKNRFELKPADGTEAEMKVQGRSSYYLSTARHKTASYTRQLMGEHAVIFVLDGIALANKYKIVPVDYWSGFYNEQDPKSRDRMEAEDRVMTNSPFIENADKYITEIHAFRGTTEDEFRAGKAVRLSALYKFALLKKIPIFFYNDTKDMLLLNKRKAVPFDRETLIEDKRYSDPDAPSAYDYKYRKNNNEITGWLQLYEMPAPKDVIGDWKKVNALVKQNKHSDMAYKHLRYQYNGDPLRQLNAGMHNEKSTAYGTMSRGREDLDRLIKILRKHRWTPKDFVAFLHKKWYGEDK